MLTRREVVGACALDCPDGCSWVVTVESDGVGRERATAVRGNADHPFTRGGLCAKVNRYPEVAAAPERLLYPLRRIGPKGSGQFERVGWDQVLPEIAARMREAIEVHGGEAIWPYAGTGSVSMVQGLGGAGRRLFHHLGASRHVPNICSVAGHAGMALTTGSAAGMDPQDLAHSGLIVLWGTNTLTTNLHLWPFVTAGRDRGAPLVVIDPVRTRTAARADVHLAPRPGTDAALALAVMARLSEQGAVDQAYLDRSTLGWPLFRDQVLAQWPLRRAAEVCGLASSEIERFADLIAAHRPLGIRALMGMQRHGGAAAALRAVSCLPAVTGDYARHGGGLCYSTGPAYGWNEAALGRPDLRPAGPTRSLVMSSLGRELLDRQDPPVTVLMMWAANPVLSNPDQQRVRDGLAREDLFTVVVDHRLTDTARYADVVLPGTTQLEHLDLTESYSHLYVQWNEPAVPPPGECRSHTEIFRGLAHALGVTEPAVYADDLELARAALDSPEMAGITPESLRRTGWQRLPRPEPFLPFAERFATPSGRFEFASAAAEAAGIGLVPQYVPPHEPAVDSSAGGEDGEGGEGGTDSLDGGLVLISAANHYLVNSTFSGSPLHHRAGEAQVLVHPDDAASRGVRDGESVLVHNDRGSFEAIARVSDAVRPGVLATTKGLRPGRSGTSVNATTADGRSDHGGGAVFADNRVRLAPTHPTPQPTPQPAHAPQVTADAPQVTLLGPDSG